MNVSKSTIKKTAKALNGSKDSIKQIVKAAAHAATKKNVEDVAKFAKKVVKQLPKRR